MSGNTKSVDKELATAVYDSWVRTRERMAGDPASKGPGSPAADYEKFSAQVEMLGSETAMSVVRKVAREYPNDKVLKDLGDKVFKTKKESVRWLKHRIHADIVAAKERRRTQRRKEATAATPPPAEEGAQVPASTTLH